VSPGFEVTGWFGILAPTGIDPAIREQLNHINEILLSPDVVERLAALGIEPLGGTRPTSPASSILKRPGGPG